MKHLVSIFLFFSISLSAIQVIIDDANIFNDTKLKSEYLKYNAYLANTYDIDLRVITTNTKQDINLFANKAFKKLQDSSRSNSGRMILLVVNPTLDQLRIEISNALEPVYTDGYISYIERKGIIPYFEANKVADGIFMVMELIKDKAQEAQKKGAFLPKMRTHSIGAGARTTTKINHKNPNAKKGQNITATTQDTPKTILKKYIHALKHHNKNPDLDIYTDTTKEFFRKWVVTDINQNHEVENLQKCIHKYQTLFDTTNTHAVLAVLPYDKHRRCSPYFFKQEKEKWKLDIASMAQMLRFNTTMQWHFDLAKRLQNEGIYYAYAFDGYGFDKNGFPFLAKIDDKEKKYRWGFSCGRWFYPQYKKLIKQNPQKYTKCWINNYTYGMPANVRLGLDVYDYILFTSDGEKQNNDITFQEFMQFMKDVPSGTLIEVGVYHHGKKIIRRGIAP
ncbi:MAG: TPM domain-containing protein [Epsilonproteobacteria bacterium]|nr:TPM domain-containing protein [Campylobacterota bacterium]